MLWTDSVFVTLADLKRIDSEVSEVAEAEGIQLTGSFGLIRGAVEEASNEMQKLLIAFGGYIGSGDFSSNHMAAVLNIGAGTGARQKATLSQIVVSGDTAESWNWIKQWVVFWTLNCFYRDAFNRTVKDRYEGKMRYYKSELQRRITPTIMALGLPLVTRPLPCPGATFERNVGTWSGDNVSMVPGSGTLDGEERDIAITYVDMTSADLYVSSLSPNNAESNPSERITKEFTTGNVLSVDIGTLNPPDGTQHASQILICVTNPLAATHWNCWVGAVGGTLYLQNTTPIPIGTTSYTLAANPTTTGAQCDIGQYATRRLSMIPTRQRA